MKEHSSGTPNMVNFLARNNMLSVTGPNKREVRRVSPIFLNKLELHECWGRFSPNALLLSECRAVQNMYFCCCFFQSRAAGALRAFTSQGLETHPNGPEESPKR